VFQSKRRTGATGAHDTKPLREQPRRRRDPKAPPKPKPITASYLRNSALYTLSQRALSVAALEDLLKRRSRRRAQVQTLDEPTRDLITTAVANLVELGLVKDDLVADMVASKFTRQGLSKRAIAQKMKAKGLKAETIAKTGVGDLDEFQQACRFIERKRLGAHRRGPLKPGAADKDLRTLARAGFSLAIARRALANGASDAE
jgi:regulatory protein